jgi:copper transporter 1
VVESELWDESNDGVGVRLLFMTYNGWVMIAVTVGAFVGYLVFGNSTSATKDGACH